MEDVSDHMSNYFLLELLCPVCLEYMTPPIRQCISGHEICFRCFDKVDTCPICRGHKGISRALSLEKIYNSVKFTCRYKVNGCEFLDVGSEMREHEKFCGYAIFPCPFNPISYPNCSWEGKRTETFQHCEQHHLERVRSESHVAFRIPLRNDRFELMRANDLSIIYLSIQSDNGRNGIFQLCLGINLDGTLHCGVFYLGSEVNRQKYKFKFFFGSKNCEKKSLWVELSPMLPVEEFMKNKNLFNQLGLFAHYEEISQLCNHAGYLHIGIEMIYENKNHIGDKYEIEKKIKNEKGSEQREELDNEDGDDEFIIGPFMSLSLN